MDFQSFSLSVHDVGYFRFTSCALTLIYYTNTAFLWSRYKFILLIDNFTVIWFVQCPSCGVLYFGRLTFADCTVTKNRLKNSNIFMTFAYIFVLLSFLLNRLFVVKVWVLYYFYTTAKILGSYYGMAQSSSSVHILFLLSYFSSSFQ